MTPPLPPVPPLDLSELRRLLAEAAPGPVCEHPNGTSIWTGEEYDGSGRSDQSMLLNASRPTMDAVAEVALIVALRNAAPSLLAMAERAEELAAERDAERLRYGQQLARRAVFMQAMATLARRGPELQEFAAATVKRADEAAANVRLEDFTAARPFTTTEETK